MAISTYSELQARISLWLDSQSQKVLVPDFIRLFEATTNRKLRVRQQEISTHLALTVPAGNDTYTKVLLHFDGTDASTTITDDNAGGSAHAWTSTSSAQIDTAQSKFGGASGLFASGNFVSTPDHADFVLGTLDWTIECWFNCTVATGTFPGIAGQSNNGTMDAATSSFRLYRINTGEMRLAVSNGTTIQELTSTSQFTDTLNTGWHHIACVRTGNTLKMFIDGVQDGTSQVFTGTVPNSSYVLEVGRASQNGTGWGGWIDEFRFSAIARWTTTFTPLTLAYSIPSPAAEASLPSDYLSWRRVAWEGDDAPALEYVTPDYFQRKYSVAAAGTPTIFTIEGSALKINSSDTTGLTVLYYAKVPELSDNTTTNWLLAAHPDLYLFGSLAEAEMFGVNDHRMMLWKVRRDEIFAEIEMLSNRTRGIGQIKVDYPTP